MPNGVWSENTYPFPNFNGATGYVAMIALMLSRIGTNDWNIFMDDG